MGLLRPRLKASPCNPGAKRLMYMNSFHWSVYVTHNKEKGGGNRTGEKIRLSKAKLSYWISATHKMVKVKWLNIPLYGLSSPYNGLLSDHSELQNSQEYLRPSSKVQIHRHMTTFWVLSNQATFMTTCSIPWSLDCILQCFCWKLAKLAHSKQLIQLMTMAFA